MKPKHWILEIQDCRYTYYRLEYKKTRHQISLYFSLQCRRFLRVRECFCSRKRHVETPEERRKWSELKAAGRGRTEREGRHVARDLI